MMHESDPSHAHRSTLPERSVEQVVRPQFTGVTKMSPFLLNFSNPALERAFKRYWSSQGCGLDDWPHAIYAVLSVVWGMQFKQKLDLAVARGCNPHDNLPSHASNPASPCCIQQAGWQHLSKLVVLHTFLYPVIHVLLPVFARLYRKQYCRHRTLLKVCAWAYMVWGMPGREFVACTCRAVGMVGLNQQPSTFVIWLLMYHSALVTMLPHVPLPWCAGCCLSYWLLTLISRLNQGSTWSWGYLLFGQLVFELLLPITIFYVLEKRARLRFLASAACTPDYKKKKKLAVAAECELVGEPSCAKSACCGSCLAELSQQGDDHDYHCDRHGQGCLAMLSQHGVEEGDEHRVLEGNDCYHGGGCKGGVSQHDEIRNASCVCVENRIQKSAHAAVHDQWAVQNVVEGERGDKARSSHAGTCGEEEMSCRDSEGHRGKSEDGAMHAKSNATDERCCAQVQHYTASTAFTMSSTSVDSQCSWIADTDSDACSPVSFAGGDYREDGWTKEDHAIKHSDNSALKAYEDRAHKVYEDGGENVAEAGGTGPAVSAEEREMDLRGDGTPQSASRNMGASPPTCETWQYRDTSGGAPVLMSCTEHVAPVAPRAVPPRPIRVCHGGDAEQSVLRPRSGTSSTAPPPHTTVLQQQLLLQRVQRLAAMAGQPGTGVGTLYKSPINHTIANAKVLQPPRGASTLTDQHLQELVREGMKKLIEEQASKRVMLSLVSYPGCRRFGVYVRETGGGGVEQGGEEGDAAGEGSDSALDTPKREREDWHGSVNVEGLQALLPDGVVAVAAGAASVGCVGMSVVPRPVVLYAPQSGSGVGESCEQQAAAAQWHPSRLVLTLYGAVQHGLVKREQGSGAEDDDGDGLSTLRVVVSLPDSTVPLVDQTWSAAQLRELPVDEAGSLHLLVSGLATAQLDPSPSQPGMPLLMVSVLKQTAEPCGPLTATPGHHRDHLLSSFSVLLLPDTAACAEISRLFDQMVDLCHGNPAAAYERHFYPFAWDLATALSHSATNATLQALPPHTYAQHLLDLLVYLQKRQMTTSVHMLLSHLQHSHSSALLDALLQQCGSGEVPQMPLDTDFVYQHGSSAAACCGTVDECNVMTCSATRMSAVPSESAHSCDGTLAHALAGGEDGHAEMPYSNVGVEHKAASSSAADSAGSTATCPATQSATGTASMLVKEHRKSYPAAQSHSRSTWAPPEWTRVDVNRQDGWCAVLHLIGCLPLLVSLFAHDLPSTNPVQFSATQIKLINVGLAGTAYAVMWGTAHSHFWHPLRNWRGAVMTVLHLLQVCLWYVCINHPLLRLAIVSITVSYTKSPITLLLYRHVLVPWCTRLGVLWSVMYYCTCLAMDFMFPMDACIRSAVGIADLSSTWCCVFRLGLCVASVMWAGYLSPA